MGTSRHEPALTGLPNTLARLYDNVRSAKALLMRAGVDTLRMDMSGSSEAMWFSILEEAAKLRRVGDIVRAAQEEYPDVLQSLSASLPPPDNAVEERTRTGDETPEGTPLPAWYYGERNYYVHRWGPERRVLGLLSAPPHASGSTPRLITLHGSGGMGKTRLAVFCAIQARGTFPDGVYWVSLEGCRASVVAVAGALGQALGLPEDGSQPQHVVAALATRNALLLLDNYESVDCDEVRGYLLEIVLRTRAVRLLITGREAVKITDAEQLVDLDGGMAPEEASELFTERTRLRKAPDWRVSRTERPSLKHILDLTGRIPLAVELAAAWTHKYSLQEIAEGLGASPTGPLSRNPHGAVRTDRTPRHTSLDRCLDWSYSLLRPHARRGFLRLGVFADSFTHETVAAACGLPDALDLLHTLHDASLVRRVEVTGRTRYTLHPPTRAYVSQRLSRSKSHATVRSRFVHFYLLLVLMEASSDDLSTLCVRIGQILCAQGEPHRLTVGSNVDQPAKRAIIDLEWRNAARAIEYAVAMERWDAAIHMAEHLSGYLRVRGFLFDHERVVQLGLNASRAAGDADATARALDALGSAFASTGRLGEARQAYLESLRHDEREGRKEGVAITCNNLGHVYRELGSWSEAEAMYRRSLKLSRELKDADGEGAALLGLGGVCYLHGRFDQAARHYHRALKIALSRGDTRDEGATLWGLANVLQAQERWAEAEAKYQRSLEIAREFGERTRESEVLCNLGVIYGRQGRWAEARDMYRRALRICAEIGDRPTEAVLLANMATVQVQEGKLSEALRNCLRSVALHREMKNLMGERYALERIAEVHVAAERWDDAQRAYECAIDIARRVRDLISEGSLLGMLAQVYFLRGMKREGRECCSRALKALRRTTDRGAISRVEALLRQQ